MSINRKIFVIALSTLIMATPCFAIPVNESNENNKMQLNALETKVNLNTMPVFAISRGNKNAYLQWLNSIDSKLDVELAYLYANGGPLQEVEAATRSYTAWDNALNEIYGVLKQQLSNSEMEALRQKQRDWIVYKEQNATEAASDFGGYYAVVVHQSRLKRLTKERCYYLVNNYM